MMKSRRMRNDRGVRSVECGVRLLGSDDYGLQFTVYGLQMITVQAIRFVYSLKFIVYR